MHRKVNPPLQERIVDLLGENRAGADTSERYLGSQITRGLDLHDDRFMAGRTEQGPYPLGLPQR
jgi:hypothetical protein